MTYTNTQANEFPYVGFMVVGSLLMPLGLYLGWLSREDALISSGPWYEQLGYLIGSSNCLFEMVVGGIIWGGLGMASCSSASKSQMGLRFIAVAVGIEALLVGLSLFVPSGINDWIGFALLSPQITSPFTGIICLIEGAGFLMMAVGVDGA